MVKDPQAEESDVELGRLIPWEDSEVGIFLLFVGLLPGSVCSDSDASPPIVPQLFWFLSKSLVVENIFCWSSSCSHR